VKKLNDQFEVFINTAKDRFNQFQDKEKEIVIMIKKL